MSDKETRFSQLPKFGHLKFYTLLEEIADLHSRKNHDYAGGDPLSNLRLSEQFGIPAWKGCLIRMSDKWSRLVQLANKDQALIKSESIRDTLLDLASYALLCVILREETK